MTSEINETEQQKPKEVYQKLNVNREKWCSEFRSIKKNSSDFVGSN